jgi:transposase, IS6 family
VKTQEVRFCQGLRAALLRFARSTVYVRTEVLRTSGTSLIGLAVHATEPASAVQGSTFRTRNHHLVRSPVLRYALSLRNLEEIMAERNVQVDHVTIWRWIQDYAPELGRRCRHELRNTNGSWRVDETYLRVAGKWTYLYRAVDSTGDTIDFLLSPKRDVAAAKHFFQKALRSPNHPRPRVVNVDGNPAYPRAIDELKGSQDLGRRCRCRPVRCLNNIVEQDHRAIKRRIRAMQGFRSFHSARRTIQGTETVNMIRKGQIRWLPKEDILGHAAFITGLFGVALAA